MVLIRKSKIIFDTNEYFIKGDKNCATLSLDVFAFDKKRETFAGCSIDRDAAFYR